MSERSQASTPSRERSLQPRRLSNPCRNSWFRRLRVQKIGRRSCAGPTSLQTKHLSASETAMSRSICGPDARQSQEIVDKQRTLRISHVDNRGSKASRPISTVPVLSIDRHVPIFISNRYAIAFARDQLAGISARRRSGSVLRRRHARPRMQKRRGASRAVARNLRLASVGIEQADGRVTAAGCRLNQQPAVRAYAGMPIADRDGYVGRASAERPLPR